MTECTLEPGTHRRRKIPPLVGVTLCNNRLLRFRCTHTTRSLDHRSRCLDGLWESVWLGFRYCRLLPLRLCLRTTTSRFNTSYSLDFDLPPIIEFPHKPLPSSREVWAVVVVVVVVDVEGGEYHQDKLLLERKELLQLPVTKLLSTQVS